MTSDLLAPASLHRLLESSVERRPLDASSPIVVYGAGNTGRRVIALLRGRGLEPIAVLDQRGGNGSAVEGIPVYLPGSEPLDRVTRQRSTVVIAVFNRDANVRDIDSVVRSLGYGRIVGVVELHDLLAPEWGDAYWMSSRDHVLRHADDVLSGMRRLSDEKSRTLYEQLIAYRLCGRPADAPVPNEVLQYFPEDVPRRDEPLRYVDCGAYDGDALRTAERVAELAAACAFEPDTANFAKLADWAQLRSKATELQLWPCAVWRITEQLRFDAGQGEASNLAASGATVVQGVALDEALPTFRATDVKMDIEGAEFEAVEGAARLIARCRPRLALCVYHRPEHLWSLSAIIEKMDLGYGFFLRAHAYGGFEVVLYAIPSEQYAA